MFSKREGFSVGWQTFKKRWVFFVVLTIITGLVSFIPGYLAASPPTSDAWLSILLNVAVWLLQLVFALGLIHIALASVTKNGVVGYGDLFSEYRRVLHYLLGIILYGLIVAVGLVLFIVPGIIFAVRMQLWPYAMVDKHIGPVASLKASWRMTKGHVINLFLFNVLVVLVTILGAILLGLGLLVATPVTMLATAWVYRKLAS